MACWVMHHQVSTQRPYAVSKHPPAGPTGRELQYGQQHKQCVTILDLSSAYSVHNLNLWCDHNIKTQMSADLPAHWAGCVSHELTWRIQASCTAVLNINQAQTCTKQSPLNQHNPYCRSHCYCAMHWEVKISKLVLSHLGHAKNHGVDDAPSVHLRTRTP